MKKSLLLKMFLAVVLMSDASLPAFADNGDIATDAGAGKTYLFVVWTKSGERVDYPVAEKPKLRHEGREFVMESSNAVIRYASKDVEKFTLELKNDGFSGVSSLPFSTETTLQSKSSGGLTISKAIPKSMVYIYDISGKIAGTTMIDDEGNAIVDTEKLPAGVYIIKNGEITYKISKK